MSFVQRELDRINAALNHAGEASPLHAQLYAAQQALAWALEPVGVKPPLDMITGTPAMPGGCSADIHPIPS